MKRIAKTALVTVLILMTVVLSLFPSVLLPERAHGGHDCCIGDVCPVCIVLCLAERIAVVVLLPSFLSVLFLLSSGKEMREVSDGLSARPFPTPVSLKVKLSD